jgi:flagellar assembly factor FliW
MFQGVMVMTGSGPAMISPSAMDEAPESELVDTRFGKVTIWRRQPIIFPTGMLGLPDKMQFCLTNFPSAKMARFKLLQSLEDPSLSFITLPVDLNNPIIARDDIELAARDLDIPLAQLAALLIVSVHRESGVVKLSVNARAPILLHAVRRLATQHVFSHAKYQIRQPLTL